MNIHHESNPLFDTGAKALYNPCIIIINQTRGCGVENNLIKYGYLYPFLVICPYEMKRLRPTDWGDLHNSVPMVESRETGCLSTRYRNGDCFGKGKDADHTGLSQR